mmetsp:Transcript_68221/g.171932  ORF Transcript_68221/g.171932 Transcript_68221/m.171932 type:complete len:248 (+) Transcript_68221:260-1003(+)
MPSWGDPRRREGEAWREGKRHRQVRRGDSATGGRRARGDVGDRVDADRSPHRRRYWRVGQWQGIRVRDSHTDPEALLSGEGLLPGDPRALLHGSPRLRSCARAAVAEVGRCLRRRGTCFTTCGSLFLCDSSSCYTERGHAGCGGGGVRGGLPQSGGGGCGGSGSSPVALSGPACCTWVATAAAAAAAAPTAARGEATAAAPAATAEGQLQSDGGGSSGRSRPCGFAGGITDWSAGVDVIILIRWWEA